MEIKQTKDERHNTMKWLEKIMRNKYKHISHNKKRFDPKIDVKNNNDKRICNTFPCPVQTCP